MEHEHLEVQCLVVRHAVLRTQRFERIEWLGASVHNATCFLFGSYFSGFAETWKCTIFTTVTAIIIVVAAGICDCGSFFGEEIEHTKRGVHADKVHTAEKEVVEFALEFVFVEGGHTLHKHEEHPAKADHQGAVEASLGCGKEEAVLGCCSGRREVEGPAHDAEVLLVEQRADNKTLNCDLHHLAVLFAQSQELYILGERGEQCF